MQYSEVVGASIIRIFLNKPLHCAGVHVTNGFQRVRKFCTHSYTTIENMFVFLMTNWGSSYSCVTDLCQTEVQNIFCMFCIYQMIIYKLQMRNNICQQNSRYGLRRARQLLLGSFVWETTGYGCACRALTTSPQVVCSKWSIYNYKMNLSLWMSYFLLDNEIVYSQF